MPNQDVKLQESYEFFNSSWNENVSTSQEEISMSNIDIFFVEKNAERVNFAWLYGPVVLLDFY